MARRLVKRAVGPADTPERVASAAHTACELAYRELTRSLGATGAEALLTRALTQVQADHPLLKEIHIVPQPAPGIDGVVGLVQTHGAPAVAVGLEALLETVLNLLGRLIGADMVARLVEPGAPIGSLDDEDGQ